MLPADLLILFGLGGLAGGVADCEVGLPADVGAPFVGALGAPADAAEPVEGGAGDGHGGLAGLGGAAAVEGGVEMGAKLADAAEEEVDGEGDGAAGEAGDAKGSGDFGGGAEPDAAVVLLPVDAFALG